MTVNRRTVGFNFLEEPELPAPQVSETQAEQILGAHYGLRAHAKSLGSQQDKNFTVNADDGAIVGVLKIANPAFNGAELEAQDIAANAHRRRRTRVAHRCAAAHCRGREMRDRNGFGGRHRLRPAVALSTGRNTARVGLSVPHCRRRSRRGRGQGEPGARRLHTSRPRPDPAMGFALRRSTLSPN